MNTKQARAQATKVLTEKGFTRDGAVWTDPDSKKQGVLYYRIDFDTNALEKVELVFTDNTTMTVL